MLHTIQVDDVIPILSPAVGWVNATLVRHVPKYVLLEHCQSVNCFVPGGTKTWLSGFHSLVLVMLYGLVTALCGVFIS